MLLYIYTVTYKKKGQSDFTVICDKNTKEVRETPKLYITVDNTCFLHTYSSSIKKSDLGQVIENDSYMSKNGHEPLYTVILAEDDIEKASKILKDFVNRKIDNLMAQVKLQAQIVTELEDN